MMDGAYFTGRKEILDWVNTTLGLGITKIEMTCTGAIACQLIDAHFPGNVQMGKINWEARNDYEYTNNYKIMQSSFNKLNISKRVDIDKLSRGKYQDNLEFMQWMMGFCSHHSVAPGYDPVASRGKAKGVRKIQELFGKPGTEVSTARARRHASSGAMGATQAAKAEARASRASAEEKEDQGDSACPEKENSRPRSSGPSQKVATSAPRAQLASRTGNAPAAPGKQAGAGEGGLKQRVGELERVNGDLKSHIEGVEKERDFYFEKLRDIEVLIQEREEEGKADDDAAEASVFARRVKQILYATTEDFVAVEPDTPSPRAANAEECKA
mmetsp:Transcript_6368/g.14676  ORF Transcript_6368/g.14676 Transcript_6368/m.14676 type:complete len:327 (+) Transcript_6368:55-1035(+)|eukprot:CAMPEP_0172584450 /NCGR_PEP_ID=MMETSP1068-20121228/4048_1 /TAXON_ID=35684 /ORGANISM="Pseudopedinella elastica, Strain CCMP716" /LENGTH=326 /DNA_ID=CAMNT_0013378635 /DNA_START=39 /DNA_END=1019 /DNA_ORIENTATION=-